MNIRTYRIIYEYIEYIMNISILYNTTVLVFIQYYIRNGSTYDESYLTLSVTFSNFI